MVERLVNSPEPQHKGYFAGMNKQVLPESSILNWDGRQFQAADQAGPSYTQAVNPDLAPDQLPEEDEFAVWVSENITKEFINTRVFYAFGTPDRPTVGCHTDLSRDFVLIYVAQKGGPDASTEFWTEEGQPRVRGYHERRFDNSKLITVDKYCATDEEVQNTWCLVNTRILHGVVGMDHTRIGLQVSFVNRVPDEVLYG
jgi:hypothetical protein